MANVQVKDIRKDKRKQNYDSCKSALDQTSEALLPFTEDKLKDLHQQISLQVGNQPICHHQCSKVMRDVNRWCITCGLWRQALLRFHTNPRELVWHKLQSWEWPKHHMNLVEVYMFQNWDKATLNASDLSVALTVWSKCSVFPATILPLADKLKKSRNKIAHGKSLDGNEKQTVFNNIKQVIQHADVVNCLQNPNEIQNIITDLENGDLFKFENESKEIIKNTNVVKNRLQTLDTKLNMVHEDQTYMFKVILWSVIATCMVVLAPVLVSVKPYLQTIFNISQFQPPVEKTGCLQEYSPLFQTSTIFVDYFKHHKPLVGREWMFQVLDEQLKNTKKNGILLKTDMGYGESDIAAHIICSKEGDQGIELRKRLIAFHVCKFEVKKTHQAGVFIQRLVSMISNNIPEFNETINKECLHSFITGQCDSDPFGCIDECIISPLKKTNISDGSDEYRLIIIDALDKCNETFSVEKSNKIFNLIEHSANMLPSWIKLLITSSRLPRNERLQYNLESIYFNKLGSRNLDDRFFNQISREMIVNIFQLPADFTQPNLISYFNRYYQDQFDRWYDHGFDFSKSILEVLITTYLKRTPENIRKVISLNASVNLSHSMFKNELSIIQKFTYMIDGGIVFNHYSLFNWLAEQCPDKKYSLSLSNGHQANAHYILHELNNSNFTFDVTDLLLNIQSANEGSGLQEQFMNIPIKTISRIENKFLEGPVVRIIKRGKMKEIPEILFHHFPGGNHFSAENISVGFIAAENGYTFALKQLVNHGADIHFRMPTFLNILTMHDAVEIATYFKHWNYGLLDVAAQHGHTETVRLILYDDLFSSYKLHKRNGINLSPWHLACIFNRSEVIEVFLQFNRSFLDWKCLYFAAEKGNIEIVKLLLDAGIYDKCVLCTNELYWIPNGTARVQGKMVPKNESMYVLFDDWSELSCESALHAAIRHNHLNVVRELLKNSKHSTLHCLDRGGRPALIAALQSNRTAMVRLFLEMSNAHRIKVQCQKVPMLKENLQINRTELVKLNHMKCRAGHGTEHAIPPMSEVLQNIIDHTNLDFNRRDEDDCLPIHYAACGNNVEYLHLLLQHHEMLFQNLLCFNNTNAFHSTIHCKAFDTFNYFINSYDKLKSRSGFGQEMEGYVLYLLKLSNDEGEYAKDATDKTWKNMFELMIEKFHVDISIMSDEKGKSMLHYIVKNGHFELLDYLVAKKSNLILELLQRGSLKRNSQITYIAKYMPKRKYVRTELVFESSLTHPLEQERKKLSAREYCFALASRFFKRHGVFKTEEQIVILKHLLRKQSYNLVDIYLKYIMSKEQIFKSNMFRIILDFDNNGHITHHYLSVLLHSIETQHRPDLKRYDILMCSTCQELREKCLVHMFTRKSSQFEGNLNNIFGCAYKNVNLRVFELMIKLVDESILSSCADHQGLNLLELAIYSKSAMLMKFFIDKGVKTSFSPEELLNRSIMQNNYEKLPITLVNATSSFTCTDLVDFHFLTYEQILNIIFDTTAATQSDVQEKNELILLICENRLSLLQSPFYISERFDHFFANFIDINNKRIPESFVCKLNSADFSFIHLLSLNGYSNSIETLVKYFGKDILTCSNIAHFLPLHFSRVSDWTGKTFNTIIKKSDNKQLENTEQQIECLFLNSIYAYKYLSTIRCLSFSNFPLPYCSTDKKEYFEKILPNLKYICSSKSSEEIRNVYEKFKNAYDVEH